jgi:hypothetical protein
LCAVGRHQHEDVAERLPGVELARRVAEVEAVDAHALALAGQNRPGSDLRRGGARIVDLGTADHLCVALSQRVERRRRGADGVDDDGDVARLERLAGRERRVDRGLAHP